MSQEFIAIIAVGVSILGFILALHLRMERRVDRAEDNLNRRIDRLEESTNRRIDRLEESTNNRIDRLEESIHNRINRLEESINNRINKLEADVKQWFGEVNDRLQMMDTRLRMVEQNQAHLAGELSSIRELLRLQPVGLD